MFLKQNQLNSISSFSMRSFLGILTLVVLFGSTAIAAVALGDWNLEKDKEGVKVYTRKSATSSLKDSKATVTIKTNVDAVLDLLRDFDNYPKWMYKCSEGRLLKGVSDREFYVYSVIDSPWPVSDRDLATHVTATQEADGTTILKMDGVASYTDKVKDRVRVPEFDGFWKVAPNGDGTVTVTYQFHSDPGGSIPDWMANSTSVDIPYHTLLNMKNKLEK